MKTRAVRDGDHWVINGEKTWITNGEYSDLFVCTCRTGEGELSHILIDREEHGYDVKGIKKLALNGQSTAQIFLSDVRVPVSNTVGEQGAGLKNTLKSFEYARCHMAMWGIGVARRAMDEAIKYAQERSQHGKPIAGHQLIADKIASMATKIDAGRLLAHRAMSMVQADQRADVECSMAKWYGTEIAVTATRDAVEIQGVRGRATGTGGNHQPYTRWHHGNSETFDCSWAHWHLGLQITVKDKWNGAQGEDCCNHWWRIRTWEGNRAVHGERETSTSGATRSE